MSTMTKILAACGSDIERQIVPSWVTVVGDLQLIPGCFIINIMGLSKWYASGMVFAAGAQGEDSLGSQTVENGVSCD